MNVDPLQSSVPLMTRSMFPPRPRNLPPSATSFAVDVVSGLASLNRKKLSKSTTLEIFNKILKEHENKHDTTTSTTTSTSTSTFISPTGYVNQRITDITRINVSKSRDATSRCFRFYIHLVSSDACNAMRHVINTNTSLTCQDIPEQIIVGRVYPISYSYPTDTALSYIRSVIPSATLTRVQHAFPSTHFKEYTYFSFSAIHYSLLVRHVFILPGQKTPLTFERMNSIAQTKRMCSLCFQTTHTRSQCPHRDTGVRFCSNCGKSTHLAKQCKEPRKCLCCFEINSHSIFDCQQYRPTYTKIEYQPSPHDFPPLPSRNSSSSSSLAISDYDFNIDYPSPMPLPADPNSPCSSSSSRSPHKRARHASFDSDSLNSHAARDNRMVSPALQQHLDNQSLTRRSPTPSPGRDRSRSSSRSSVSSTASAREQQLEQQVKDQQVTIHRQQQEQQQQAQEIKRLKEQLALIIEQLKLAKTPTTTTTTTNTAATKHVEPAPMRD